MAGETSIKLFEAKQIRSVWDEKEEKWYFSVIDVIEVLSDSLNPRDYWYKMKIRVKTEDGIELSTNCRQLKLKSPDGKMRQTDVAHTQALFRIIQSIPSPKAEPFKQWLAKVGYERMKEISDPEQSLDRVKRNRKKRDNRREFFTAIKRKQKAKIRLLLRWDIQHILSM